ncbi:MAG: galactokinase, partial [Maribacter sp.]
GEHTDYNDGFVFPAAIDKGIYAAFGPSNSNLCVVHALDMDESYEFTVDHLVPLENGSWKNYILGVVQGILDSGKTVAPFNLVFGGNIPEGAGLSSSAALENAVVFGLNELQQLRLSKTEMIMISQKAEHEFVGVKCGIMDQFASMFGQKNKALLLDCRSISAKTFSIDLKDFQFLLINTNVKHSLSDSAYNNRREVCEKIAGCLNIRALRDATPEALLTLSGTIHDQEYQMALYVIEENERAQQAGLAMKKNNINELGKLLFASHHGLRHQYKVSCEELDFLVDLAKLEPAIAGSRMMGGGFGGCTITIIKKNAAQAFIEKATAAYNHKFGRDCSAYEVSLSDGTHLLALG